eukprot:751239-Hanusia_phi.AAC.1
MSAGLHWEPLPVVVYLPDVMRISGIGGKNATGSLSASGNDWLVPNCAKGYSDPAVRSLKEGTSKAMVLPSRKADWTTVWSNSLFVCKQCLVLPCTMNESKIDKQVTLPDSCSRGRDSDINDQRLRELNLCILSQLHNKKQTKEKMIRSFLMCLCDSVYLLSWVSELPVPTISDRTVATERPGGPAAPGCPPDPESGTPEFRAGDPTPTLSDHRTVPCRAAPRPDPQRDP